MRMTSQPKGVKNERTNHASDYFMGEQVAMAENYDALQQTQHTETATPKRYVMVNGALTESFNPATGKHSGQWMECTDHDRVVAALQAKLTEAHREAREKQVTIICASETIDTLRTQLAQAQNEALKKAISEIEKLRFCGFNPRLNVPGEPYFLQAIKAIRALLSTNSAEGDK